MLAQLYPTVLEAFEWPWLLYTNECSSVIIIYLVIFITIMHIGPFMWSKVRDYDTKKALIMKRQNK